MNEDTEVMMAQTRERLRLSDAQNSPPPEAGEFDDKGIRIRVPRSQWLSAANRTSPPVTG